MSTEKKVTLMNSKGETFVVDEADTQSETIRPLIEDGSLFIIPTEKKVTLVSSDGETFVVDEAVALQFKTIQHMIEYYDGNGIQLLRVNSKILVKVIEYCKKHVKNPKNPKGDDRSANEELENEELKIEELKIEELKNEELRKWDAEFVNVDQATLFEVVLAANYLHIEPLLELTSQTVADMFKGKTLDQIRAAFDIKNDLTPMEEEKVRRENYWVSE